MVAVRTTNQLPETSGSEIIRVLMVVTNPCVNDSRVIKSAELIAGTGHEVCVLCRAGMDLPSVSYINGVEYKRVPMEFRKQTGISFKMGYLNDFKSRVIVLVSIARNRIKKIIDFDDPVRSMLDERNSELSYYCEKVRGIFLLLVAPFVVVGTYIFYGYKKLIEIISDRKPRKFPVLTSNKGTMYFKWLIIVSYNLLIRKLYKITRRAAILFYYGVVYRTYKLIRKSVFQYMKWIKQKWKAFLNKRVKKHVNGYFIQDLALNSINDEAIKFWPHLIHAHDLMTLPASIRLAETTGAKVIYDAHELETHRNGLKRPGQIMTWLVERKYIQRADAVITVCDSIADYLARKYRIKRPAVVMNAPDISEIEYVGPSLRNTLNLPGDTPLAVYVGKLTIGRGLDELVEAMQHCSEFHVALLGPSVASVEKKLVDSAVRLGVRDRLHIVPSVAPETVMEYIKSADIGVIPIQDVCLSYRYCMPNKLFEMAFSGIPACVSDLPEMKTFVEREHVGITMDQTDPKDIARAMQELYTRRPEFVMTGERREALFKKYAWETQAEKLKEVYRQVLNQQQHAELAV